MLDVLDHELGGWPILQGAAWKPSQYNLSRLLLTLRSYDNNIIYNCGTATDDRNSSMYYIRVRRRWDTRPVRVTVHLGFAIGSRP